MRDGATAQLDNQQFERALAIVERETPTRQQSWWFRRLQQVVSSALLLSAAWAVLASYYGVRPAYPVLLLAVACYLAVLPLLAVNLGMMRKLVRAARLRRTLRLAARLDPHFRERRRRHRLYNGFTLAMSAIGYLSLAIGVALLILELPEPDTWGLAITALMFAWGLSCIALHFMARGAERLEVISELRAALLESKSSAPLGSTAPVIVAAEQYDALSRLERAQVQSDRKRSIAAGLREKSDSYVLRLSSTFRDAELTLDGDVLWNLHDLLYKLAQDPTGVPSAPHQSFVPVPGTSFEVLCRVDHEQREVRVYSLQEAGTTPARAPGSREEPS